MNLVDIFNKKKIDERLSNSNIANFSVGDTVNVVTKIMDGSNARMHTFTGLCIAKKSRNLGSTFVVRRMSIGSGVERVFQLYSPLINSISVVKYGKVRRAKLYYIRSLKGKAARIKTKR